MTRWIKGKGLLTTYFLKTGPWMEAIEEVLRRTAKVEQQVEDLAHDCAYLKQACAKKLIL